MKPLFAYFTCLYSFLPLANFSFLALSPLPPSLPPPHTVPEVSRVAVDRSNDITTTTQDSFSSVADFSKFSSSGSRRAPAPVDSDAEDAIRTVVRPDTAVSSFV